MPTSLDRDRDLLTALLEREPTAAEALIDAYGDRAYRLALRITGNVQDAEEVVQDALCAVIWKIGDFRGESAFGSWIFRIVANAAYNKLRGRHNRRREVSLDEVLPAFAEGGRQFMPMADWSTLVDDPAVQSQLRLALTAAIEDLPALYRVALVLHDVEDLSHTEIAEQLCLTLPAVKTRVHRARLFLRNRLGEAMKMLTGDV
jgi:RNA polymerase sigma-70 factor, ECF subfamily